MYTSAAQQQTKRFFVLLGVQIAFVLLLLIGAAVISLSIVRIRTTDETLQAYRVRVNQMNIDLLMLQSSLRGYISTSEPILLEPYTRLFPKITSELEFLMADAPLPAEIAQIQTAYSRWRSDYAEPEVAAMQAGDIVTAERLLNEGNPSFTAIAQATEELRLALRGQSQVYRDRIGLLNWLQLGNVVLLTVLITTSSLVLYRFWRRERRLVGALATSTAEQVRTDVQLSSRIDESRFISTINDALARETHTTSAYQLVASQVSEFVGGWCSIVLRQPAPDDEQLFVAALHHPDPDRLQAIKHWLDDQEISVNQGLHASVFATHTPLVMLQMPPELRHPADLPAELTPIAELVNLTSYIAVPINVQDAVLGVLSVASSTDEHYFDAAQELFLVQVADRVASWIENNRLYHLAEQRAAELQTSFDSITDIIVTYDSKGRKVRINKTGRTFLGDAPLDALAPGLVWRKPNGTVLPAEEHPVQQALRGESVQDVELAIPRADNHLVVHTVSVSPLQIADGQIGGAVLVARDITVRKELERLKEELVANMSHELRTPLTAILGYSELLLKRRAEVLTPWHLTKIEGIRTGGQRLLALVNDLLDIAKLDAGHVELQIQPNDINRLLQAQASALQPMMSEKQQQLALHFAPDLPPINLDADRISQVITNLLSNAIKFTPVGGTITVDTGCVTINNQTGSSWHEQPLALTLPSLPNGEYVVASIADTGVGIAPETLPHLWDRFYQAEGGTSRRFGGTGLGLSIVSQLIELHGGKVWASSPGIDQGSVFAFALPVVTAAPSPPEPQSSGKPLILVIESDLATARMFEQSLVAANYDVVVKHNAADALAWAQTNYPKAVTLDLLLPENSGWDILAALRRIPHMVDIPVVLASTQDVAVNEANLGVSTYLVKPVTGDALIRIIQQLVGSAARTSSFVLIVDDDVDMAELVGVTLQEHGYLTRIASDGSIALDLLRTSELPSLIVLDLMMPIVDGFQLLARLRDEPRTASVPVIVLTARDLSNDEVKQLRRAAQGIQAKHTLNMGQFIAEVQRHVALKEEGMND